VHWHSELLKALDALTAEELPAFITSTYINIAGKLVEERVRGIIGLSGRDGSVRQNTSASASAVPWNLSGKVPRTRNTALEQRVQKALDALTAEELPAFITSTYINIAGKLVEANGVLCCFNTGCRNINRRTHECIGIVNCFERFGSDCRGTTCFHHLYLYQHCRQVSRGARARNLAR
jgi:hypothetical protein